MSAVLLESSAAFSASDSRPSSLLSASLVGANSVSCAAVE